MADSSGLSERIVPIVVLVILFGSILFWMWTSWQRRAYRDANLPAPDAIAESTTPELWEADGVYVSTTKAGWPLERITAYGMGSRSQVTVRLRPDRIKLLRSGATSFEIPMKSITGVKSATGMAGKVVGRDGLAVVRWRLGSSELETGIRFNTSADHEEFFHQTSDILQETPHDA